MHPKNIPLLGHFYCKNLMFINIYDTHANEMMMWHLCGIRECIRNSHSHMWTHVFSWEHSFPVWEHPLVPHECIRSHMGQLIPINLGICMAIPNHTNVALRNTLWRWRCENEGLYEDVGLQCGGMVKWLTQFMSRRSVKQ